MNFCNVTENLVSTILSAAIIAAVAWIYSFIRNLRLEAQLSDAINPNGVDVGFDQSTYRASFTLQIHNYANATIRVRAVAFIAEKFHIELRPVRDKEIYQTPLSNEIVRPQFKRKHLSKGSLEPDNNPHSMLLPPKTMGIWEIAPDTIGTHEWVIKDIFIVFEYATVFGNSALVRIKAKEPTLSLVKKNFEPLAKAVHNKQPYDLFPERRNR